MQELINRTSGIADSLLSATLEAAYLASYLGLSYLVLSIATASLAQMLPAVYGARTD